MSLEIELDEKRKTWHPGDTVSGTLSLNPYKQIDVKHVKVFLDGDLRLRQYGQQQHSHDIDIRLFRKQAIVFQGPYTLASAQEWRFALQFPEDCHHADKQGVFPNRANPADAEWLSAERSKTFRLVPFVQGPPYLQMT